MKYLILPAALFAVMLSMPCVSAQSGNPGVQKPEASSADKGASDKVQEPAVVRTSVAGMWKEFWAPGQQTDVTYHDEYEVSVSESGSVSVKLKNTDGANISGAEFSAGVLTFTQKTSFEVRYQLRLSSDGSVLEGTATTPAKTVPIRWERQ